VKHQKGEPDASTLMREAIHLQQQRKCQLGLIESLDRCAWMTSNKGEAARAATLFGAADILRQSLGLVYPLGDKPLGDMYLAKARAGLAALSFNDAWSEGKSLSLEAAAAFAEAGLGA
jgi:hypothetical protein